MEKRKEVAVADFQLWLCQNDIEHKTLMNGHFQIYKDGVMVHQVWATTQKILNPDGTKKVGMEIIKKQILTTYNKI